MIDFTRPANLNGAELIEELKAVGVEVVGWPKLDGDKLSLNINEADKDKAELVVKNHNGTTVASEPTIQDKLASVGLSVKDLKDALGL